MIIEADIDLQKYNTLQIPAKAKYFVVVKRKEDVEELMNSDLWQKEKHCILGGGANILFTQDFDGIVIKNEIIGKKILEQKSDSFLVEVGAGENWSDFVEWTCINNMAGIENLINIPGNVGTAPVSNIGAYGVEISDFIYDVQGINLKTGETKIFSRSECDFSYRNSIFKGKLKQDFMVSKVRFLLNKFDEKYIPNIGYSDIQKYLLENNLTPRTPTEISEIITIIRNNKLPDWHKIGTAGSFFSNPIISQNQRYDIEKLDSNLVHHEIQNKNGEVMYKLSAGQLIEKCGLKGRRIPNGTAGTYEKHALILVNEGGTSEDVLAAMNIIQDKVKEKFGINLFPEVVLI